MNTIAKRGATRNDNCSLVSVYDGQLCIGFILNRGKLGHEAIDKNERSLGLFKTTAQAANAIIAGGANV
jgi:hypothetical protein